MRKLMNALTGCFTAEAEQRREKTQATLNSVLDEVRRQIDADLAEKEAEARKAEKEAATT